MPLLFSYPRASDVGRDAGSKVTDVRIAMALTARQRAERDFSDNTGAIGRLKPRVSVSDAQAESSVLMATHPRTPFPRLEWMARRRDPLSGLGRARCSSPALVPVRSSDSGPADCVQQRRASHAGTCRGSQPRDCGSSGTRRRPWPTRSTTADRGHAASRCRRCAWHLCLVRGCAPAAIDRSLERFPGLDKISVDWRVLSFGAGLSVLTGMTFGLFPALTASRTEIGDVIKRAGSARTTSSSRMRGALVVLQVSLAVLLVAGATLLIESYRNVLMADRGFSSSSPKGLSCREERRARRCSGSR